MSKRAIVGSLLLCLAVLSVCSFLIINKLKGHFYPSAYKSLVYEKASFYDLDPLLIASIISAESSFNPQANSKKGARGLMQIMPLTGIEIARELSSDEFDFETLFDPQLNIEFGCYYLSRLNQKYNNIEIALMAYNAGATHVDSWLKDVEDPAKLIESDQVFTATKKYILKIKRIYNLLKFMNRMRWLGYNENRS